MFYPLYPCVLCIAIASLAVTGAASAQNIYKWKDQNGTTHYGELPPPSGFSSVEVLDIQPPRPVSSNSGDTSYRSALELANSLQADRLKREKLRLEKERLMQQGRQAQQEAQRYNDTYRSQSYSGDYYPYRSYPRRRPSPHHSKPQPRPPQSSPVVTKRVYLGR